MSSLAAKAARPPKFPALTEAEVEHIISILPTLSEADRKQLSGRLEQALRERHLEACRNDFLTFVQEVWPDFLCGPHHRVMAREFQDLAEGKQRRLTISLAPRSGKSELTSYLFPAWFLGKYPNKKVLQASYKADLAVGFGRKVRNLFSDPKFKEIFPGISLKADNKAAGRWETNHGGTYYAAGVGAGIAGFGADIVIIDDPVSDQEAPQAQFDPEIFNRVYNWYQVGPRQRLQPGARILVVMTRWGERDLIGRLKADEKERGGDKWHSIEFPAIKEDGSSYWPDFWPIEELQATKTSLLATGSNWMWQAQYQQNPTGQEGALIKSSWWNLWPRARPPECQFVIQVWDTATKATQRSNYSVCTTWGVFSPPDEDSAHIICLDMFRDKLEFPELKAKAIELYRGKYPDAQLDGEYKPDSLVIEGKNAGDSLIFELRRMGIYVENYTPTRGDGDKVARVNAITDIFASGVVWTMDKDWTETMLSECQSFPMGANDDIVDTVAMALARFRRGNFISLNSDEQDEYEPDYKEPANYY